MAFISENVHPQVSSSNTSIFFCNNTSQIFLTQQNIEKRVYENSIYEVYDNN
ncbi:unnamed protein product [Sphenostylis stenocarpa]|uniref:Uncharacterized protein n=1 Tax=Sphenostylis stenocarpa TaxID=92480 RepID=A0AA86RNA3_9FABA|nr:unnamed protein product [Sphenostylis stenocarpa]